MTSKQLAILYFILSIIITYVFVDANPVYHTDTAKLFAFLIAVIVWALQVIGAFVFLQKKKYSFLREAGKVCFWGSASLMISVFIFYNFPFSEELQLKISALNVLLSVILMSILFARFLNQMHLPFTWLLVWLASLLIALPLQAKLVGLW